MRIEICVCRSDNTRFLAGLTIAACGAVACTTVTYPVGRIINFYLDGFCILFCSVFCCTALQTFLYAFRIVCATFYAIPLIFIIMSL